jgi:hypothetical protein
LPPAVAQNKKCEQAQAIAAIDLCIVPTLTFERGLEEMSAETLDQPWIDLDLRS